MSGSSASRWPVNWLPAEPPVTREIVDAAFSLQCSSKIVQDLEETAAKRFRYDALVDATDAS
jgi:hypothetical protein